MTQLKLADVNFNSEVFKNVLNAVFTHKLALFNSMLMQAPEQLVSSQDKGYYVSMPSWSVISGDADKITDGLTTTINKLSQIKDRGVWVEREKAWGADQIILTVAGQQHDSTVAVASMLGEYWAAEIHKSGISVLTGVFATELTSSHCFDDSGSTINPTGIVKAKQKLGDNASKLTAIGIHSKVEADALTAKILTYDKANPNTLESGNVGNILGLTPHVSDLFAAVADVYPSYLGMMGSMIYKTRVRPNAQYTNENLFRIGNLEIELYRNSTSNGGIDSLISRLSYMTHVPGVQYDDTGGVNPTNAVLATGTSWTKVQTDDKLIPLVCYKSA